MIATVPPFPGLRLQRAIFAMVFLAVATFCLLDETATPLVVAVAVMGCAWLLQDTRRVQAAGTGAGRPGDRIFRVPVMVVNTIVVIAALAFFYEVQAHADEAGHFFVTALSHFIITLLLCKMFERRTPRDVGQILILCLLIVVASTMYSQSMSFAVLLGAFFVAMVYVLLLSYLQHDAAALGATIMPVTFSRTAANPTRALLRATRRAAWISMLLLLPVAILVFLLMPRNRTIGMGTGWGRGPNVTFQTGLSATVQFHDFGQLTQSDEIVMEVRLTQNNDNLGSPYFDPYFRGLTLDRYDARTRQWSNSHDAFSGLGGITVPMVRNHVDILPPKSYPPAGAIWQDYKVRLPAGHLLFALAPAASIDSSQFESLSVEPGDFTITFGEARGPLRYRVVSAPAFMSLPIEPLYVAPDDSLDEDAPPTRPAPPAPVPPPPPDVESLPPEIDGIARSIAGDLFPKTRAELTPERIRMLVVRYETHLRETYPYSLEFRQVDHRLDPTVDFLLNRKSTGGHCEFFASAMVMLCRATGMNARIVQGYHGADYNSISGTYIVRQLHAHAWAEVYVPAGAPDERASWLQSDPSPIATPEDDPNSVVGRWARELTQIIQNTWLSSVVSFDDDSRRAVVQWAESILAPVNALGNDLWSAVVYGMSASDTLWMRLSLLGPIAGMMLLGLWALQRWYRGRRVGERLLYLRSSAKLAGERGFMDELLRLVSRRVASAKKSVKLARGEVRQASETPREYIERHATALGAAWKDIRWLLDTFYELRFGGLKVDTHVRGEVSSAMGRVRKSLRDSSS